MRIIAVKNITAVDLAAADTAEADSSVVMTAGAVASGDILFWERWSRRGADPIESMQEYYRQMRVYQCSIGIIERNRFEYLQKTMKRLGSTGLFGDAVDAARIRARTHTVTHGTDKRERITSGLAGMLRAHKLWFPDDWDDVRNFLLLYPAVDHDDLGDCMEMIVAHATAPRTTFIERISGKLGRRRSDAPDGPADITSILAKRKYNIFSGVAHE